jgi:gliding motility-associated-like protein
MKKTATNLSATFLNTSHAETDVSYQWDFGDGSEIVGQHPIHTYSQPGTYVVKLTATTSCETEVVEQSVNVYSPLAVSLGDDQTFCIESGITLTIQGMPDVGFLWSDGSTNNSLKVTHQGDYWVEVTRGLCDARDTVTLTEMECNVCDAFIPNVFTPNGDDQNNRFSLIPECIVLNLEIQIIDRWGNTVFSGNDLQGWDGNAHGEEVPNGVYFYLMTYSFKGAEARIVTTSKKGVVSLIR